MGQIKNIKLHIVTDIKTCHTTGIDMPEASSERAFSGVVGGYSHTSGYGVDAVLNETITHRPYCQHGPTILFERYFKDKTSRRFFACSACRDRKQCAFFQWEDEKMTKGKVLLQKETKKKLYQKGKSKPIQLHSGDSWCFDCSTGYNDAEIHSHTGHTVKLLQVKDIAFPTQFLNPYDAKKSRAQYFFAEDACEMLLKNIKKCEYKNVICMGTPRLFEVMRASNLNVSSILLDIDSRFENFYPPNQFLLYNMFTHFFYDKKGEREKQFNDFVSECKPEETLLLIDPPFGGLLDILQQTVSKIWTCFKAESIPTMLVFPYFMENHVARSSPTLLMHDFKVNYSNHPTYTSTPKQKQETNKQARGSPVRVFTNIPSAQLSFPTDAYHFCKLCQRYVYNRNRHCKSCNACTSKDGRTYVHCDTCAVCVKPNYVHCATCGGCKPEKHVCGDVTALQGCHVCGAADHKRRSCPKKVKVEISGGAKKRKFASKKREGSKKKKI